MNKKGKIKAVGLDGEPLWKAGARPKRRKIPAELYRYFRSQNPSVYSYASLYSMYSYASLYSMATDRGADDSREGKSMDDRMRVYASKVNAPSGWDAPLWSAYKESYLAALSSRNNPGTVCVTLKKGNKTKQVILQKDTL